MTAPQSISTPPQSTSATPSGEDRQKNPQASKPLKSSKFNDLSTSLAFAITGLVVVYLPDLMEKSLNWRIEGRFLGIALALTGAVTGLSAASRLTGRSGFGYWGFSTLIGALDIGIVATVHVYHMSKWSAVILITLAIALALIVVYGTVSGFTIFFDEFEVPAVSPENASHSQEVESAALETATEKRLSWYERITLIIAFVSTVGTLAAAIEPFVH